MRSQLKHLVFYDGECGLCDQVVQVILKEDKKQAFIFAPLQGQTAAQYLRQLPPEIRFTDSLILIEDYHSANPRLYLLGKGALRIAWLLGGPWMLIGWLSFLPGWMFDWLYRLIAKNRHFFSNNICILPPANQKDRFLP